MKNACCALLTFSLFLLSYNRSIYLEEQAAETGADDDPALAEEAGSSA